MLVMNIIIGMGRQRGAVYLKLVIYTSRRCNVTIHKRPLLVYPT